MLVDVRLLSIAKGYGARVRAQWLHALAVWEAALRAMAVRGAFLGIRLE